VSLGFWSLHYYFDNYLLGALVSILEEDIIGPVLVFVCDFDKRGLVLIITSEIELEILRPLCKGFFYRKKVLKKGYEMHSGYL